MTTPNETLAIVPRVEDQAIVPADMILAATGQAKALAKLIESQKLYSVISGRKYVKVEGWVPLARMNGVIPREISNEQQEDGRYIARVQLVRVADGTVLTEASSECGGPEEEMWQKRAPYARRSMAATRATGKACRLAYSWIIALGGYEPTPAEEMPTNGDDIPHYPAHDPGEALPPPRKKYDSEADSFWSFVRKTDGNRIIGVIEGEIASATYLSDAGFQKGRGPGGKWYAPYTPDLIELLKAAGLTEQRRE